MTNAELKQLAIELVGEQELSRRFRVWIGGLIKKERIKRAESTPDAFFLNEATVILDDLNERTGRRYTLNPETRQMIRARMSEGHNAEDFIRVHEVMVSKWLGDSKMTDYVRPSTLYRPTHFGEYLALWQPRKSQEVEGSKGREVEELRRREVERGKEVIAKLMAKKWWEFESWAEFMKWTVQLPDQDSLEAYGMPERLRKMRLAPKMLWMVLKGESPQWAEDEYMGVKKQNGH